MNERQMPKKGDIFEGKINDLSQYDAAKWRRRDIWFFKRELNRGEIFDYPSARDAIILIDTESKHYRLNFSKPELENKVCLGTPSKLKPWYENKLFDYGKVKTNERVYFIYSGHGVEFSILTEEEYRSKIYQ